MLKKNRNNRKRSVWVRTCLGRRNNPGFYETLVQEWRMEDISEYKKLLRMTPHDFDESEDFFKMITKQNKPKQTQIWVI